MAGAFTLVGFRTLGTESLPPKDLLPATPLAISWLLDWLFPDLATVGAFEKRGGLTVANAGLFLKPHIPALFGPITNSYYQAHPGHRFFPEKYLEILGFFL
jgi:hypothetical protein